MSRGDFNTVLESWCTNVWLFCANSGVEADNGAMDFETDSGGMGGNRQWWHGWKPTVVAWVEADSGGMGGSPA